MKLLYIENYLTITREKKMEFLKYIYRFKRFKVINQKILLDDSSLIIEFSKESSLEIAKKSIDLFFKNNNKDIKTLLVDKLKIEEHCLYLFKDTNLVKEIKL